MKYMNPYGISERDEHHLNSLLDKDINKLGCICYKREKVTLKQIQAELEIIIL